jgi:hypothetical protein
MHAYRPLQAMHSLGGTARQSLVWGKRRGKKGRKKERRKDGLTPFFLSKKARVNPAPRDLLKKARRH